MSIKSVVKMGNKELGKPSLPITNFADPKIKTIIQDMYDTMIAEGGVGIAAPQIGYNVRILMFGFDASENHPNELSIPLTILINPTYEVLSDEMHEDWEGCLSVPGMRGMVPRYTKLKYSGFDPKGNLITQECSDFHARVFQHEYDHLDGILYPQRIRDMSTFGFNDAMSEQLAVVAE